jgi:creatinine amidohydrolase
MREWNLRHMTWPEVNVAVKQRRVVVIPVGAIEQHGPHLPLDMDNLAVEAICERAGRKAPDLLLVAPPIHYGYNEHNMDFPGTVTADAFTFVNYSRDVAHSFGRMGFQRVIFLNGHGSNAHLLELAARQATLLNKAWVASVSHWDLVREAFAKIRESVFPGGVAHACEFETSIYLHLAPEYVRTDKIRNGVRRQGKYFWEDLMAGSAVKFTDWRSKATKTGVGGDPTLATPEKGKKMIDAAVEAFIAVAQEFRALDPGERANLCVGEPATSESGKASVSRRGKRTEGRRAAKGAQRRKGSYSGAAGR